MRRSTRVKNTGASTNRGEEGQTNEDSPPTHQVTSAPTIDKGPRKSSKTGNKRKREPQTKDNNVGHPKRMRSIRGLLESVSTMPLDVLVEIFIYLDPIDLLHLTWTTKDLRKLLLTKNANSSAIWKNSISNVPDLPQCPEDLSEPKYVHLLFAEVCHLCERKVKAIEIFWEARIRACKKCTQNEFNIQTVPKILKPVQDLIPSTTIKLRQEYWTMYHRKTCVLWEEECQQVSDKQAWIQCKNSESRTMREHIKACRIWKRNYEKMIEDEKKAIIESRQSMVMERLEKLGWKKEQISDLSFNNVHPLKLAPVHKACQNNLTDKILSGLEPILDEYMQALKTAGQARTREELLSKHRLPMLKKAYDEVVATLPANSIYPGIADVFVHPAVQENINLPMTVEVKEKDFKLGSLFSEITAQWKKDVKERLIAMIPDNCIPENTKKSANLFELATVSFHCDSLGCPARDASLRYPEVMMHWCSSTVSKYYNETVEDADLRIVKDRFFSVTWNATSGIKFSERAFKFLSEAVKMCGLDPITTTVTQMDEMSSIFECMTCNDEYYGRATMGWDNLAMHWLAERTKHGPEADGALLVLLDESEASNVRPRIVEEKERARAKPNYNKMICMSCKQVGNVTDLVKHAKKEHGLSAVTEEDIAPQIGLGRDSYLFRLWPPRVPGELGPTPMVME